MKPLTYLKQMNNEQHRLSRNRNEFHMLSLANTFHSTSLNLLILLSSLLFLQHILLVETEITNEEQIM